MTDDLPDDATRDGRAPKDLDPIATRLPASSAQSGLTPGTVIDGRYTITGPGIPGGMGVVYPASHQELNKPRALKVLHPYLVANVEAVARFRQEASLTLELLHPNIVRVFDFGDWTGQKYLVMEWISGGSLRQELERQRAQAGSPRLPLDMALALIRSLAEALAYAHGQHVLHRDLKPENILLAEKGAPKLTDFGIAKLLDPTVLRASAARLGTPYYMAPEQLQGEAVDARADLYSLGVILYELVCGDLPVGRFPLPHETDPTLPTSLDTLIERCLARRPADRFRNLGEFQAALQTLEREIAEAEARRRAAEEAERRRKQEEVERKRQADEAARRTAEETERRRQAEAKAAQERKRREVEDAERRRQEEIARQAVEEAERQRQAEADRRRQEERERQEAAERAEQERRRAEEAARQERNRRFLFLGSACLGVVLVLLAAGYALRRHAPTSEPPAAQAPPAAPMPGAPRPVPPARTDIMPHTRGIDPGTVRRLGTDDAEKVYIRAGEMWMGSSREEVDSSIAECKKASTAEATCRGWFERELPRHRVILDAYNIDRYEVTNALFARFVEAQNYRTTAEGEGRGWVFHEKEGRRQWGWMAGADWRRPMGPDSAAQPTHPVVHVSWHDTDAYCKWAGKRLPTEAEWEMAARGADRRRFPWGGEWDSTKANGAMMVKTTSPVGSYPGGVSPYGVHDLAGNVWEWVQDWYGPYTDGTVKNPAGPTTGERRVIRGGSWSDIRFHLTSGFRGRSRPIEESGSLGFRCTQSP